MIEFRTYDAHPKQRLFHKCVRQYDFTLFNGGRGSGKTTSGAIQAILEAERYQPASRGVIVAPTFPMLEDASMAEFFKWLPRHHIHEFNKQRKLLTLVNGSEIAFRSAENPDSLRGPNRTWAWLDEPRNLRNREAFDIVAAQLRPTVKCWLTTTPSGVFHWLYDLFIEKPLPSSYVVTVRTDENPYIPQTFAARLKAQYTGTFAQQELDAEWVNFEGRVYDNFSSTENVTPDADYNPALRNIWGVDDGYAYGDGPGHENYHPRVILFMQQTALGGINVVDEYVRCGISDYNETIDEALGMGYGRPDIAYIDSSAAMFKGALWNKTIQASGATHEVSEGIKNVRRLICDGNGVRLLKIHPRCKNLIRELLAYRKSESAGKGGELKPLKIDDHCPDALRYGTWYLRWNQ